MVRIVQAVVPPSPKRLIVDIGCGAGANLGRLAGSYRCIGVDPSKEMIDAASQRYPSIDFICGEVPEDLPDEAKRADVYLLMDVLEHVEDDQSLFAKVTELGHPETIVIVTVPANPDLWSPHDEAHAHFRRYTKDGLRALVATSKAEIELLSYFNSRLYPAFWFVRRLEKYLGGGFGPMGSDLSMPPPSINSVLARTFAGEGNALLESLRAKGGGGYERGASLIAVIRLEET